ncbi:MAG: DUF2357 domain-containing protein [bacterium]
MMNLSKIMIPELPEFEKLEELSSTDKLSLAGSWWITLQLVEHIFKSISSIDNITDQYLPDLLSSFMNRYFNLLQVSEIRPLPYDTIYHLINLCHKNIEYILKNPKSKIIKENRKVPVYKASKFNSTTMNWLGKQPGRTVREKLQKDYKILSRVSEFSYELKENQVAVKTLQELISGINKRIEEGINNEAYDFNEDSSQRFDRMDNFLKLKDEYNKSVLSEIKPIYEVQPNNVLISDRNYSVIWRTLQQLINYRFDIRDDWDFAFDRYFHAVYWGVCSYLASMEETKFLDKASIISDNHEMIGLESLVVEKENDDIMTFILKTGSQNRDDSLYLIELRPESDKEDLSIEVYISSMKNENNKYIVSDASELISLKYLFKAATDVSLEKKRGIPYRVKKINKRDSDDREFSEDWYFESFSDIKGIKKISRNILKDMLLEINGHEEYLVNNRLASVFCFRKEASNNGNYPDVDGNFRNKVEKKILLDASFDFSTYNPVIMSQGKSVINSRIFSFYSVSFETLNEDIVFAANNDSLYDLNSKITGFKQIFSNNKFSYTAFQQVIEKLRKMSGLKEKNYFSYTIPDIMDEFSQGKIKSLMNSLYERSFPVWRSIAAALYWQKNRNRKMTGDEIILVVDSQQTCLSTTLLRTNYDKKYKDFIFERFLPFPVDDKDFNLTYERLMHQYLDTYLKKKEIDICDSEKENILETGILESIVKEKDEYIIPLKSSDGEIYLKIQYDNEIYDLVLKEWLDEFQEYLYRLNNNDKISNESSSIGIIFLGDHFDKKNIEIRKILRGKITYPYDFLNTEDVLQGATEVSRRLRCGLPTWTEHLPNLSLEVIRDGHFSKLDLIKDKSVNQVFGEEQEFEIDATLTLTEGRPFYSFPLIKEDVGKNSIHFDARIESSSFPLTEDIDVSLHIKYKYGFENSYNLTVVPKDKEEVPFNRIQVKWVEKKDQEGRNIYPDMPNYKLSGKDLIKLINILEEVEKRLNRKFDRIRNSINGTSNNDNIEYIAEQLEKNKNKVRKILRNNKNDQVRQYIKEFKSGKFIKYLAAAAGVESPDFTEKIFQPVRKESMDKLVKASQLFLCSFGGYTPRSIQKFILQDKLNIDKVNLELLGRLSFINPDNDDIFNTMVTVFKKEKNESLIDRAIRAITMNLWYESDLIYLINEKYPGIFDELLSIIENKLNVFPEKLKKDRKKMEQRQKEWSYCIHFRDYLELILAILRLRKNNSDMVITAGSKRMLNLARTIRRIDAMFYEFYKDNKNWEIESRINFNFKKADDLANMSDLAYVVHAFLIGKEESNLIKVVSVNDMD